MAATRDRKLGQGLGAELQIMVARCLLADGQQGLVEIGRGEIRASAIGHQKGGPAGNTRAGAALAEMWADGNICAHQLGGVAVCILVPTQPVFRLPLALAMGKEFSKAVTHTRDAKASVVGLIGQEGAAGVWKLPLEGGAEVIEHLRREADTCLEGSHDVLACRLGQRAAMGCAVGAIAEHRQWSTRMSQPCVKGKATWGATVECHCTAKLQRTHDLFRRVRLA